MIRQTIIKMKKLYGRHILGKSEIEMWSQMELQRRIRTAERKKTEFKEKMDEAKDKYDTKIKEAKHAEETRVPEIKSAATNALKEYERFRTQWVTYLKGLRFLQKVALAKDTKDLEGLPIPDNPRGFETTAGAMQESLEDLQERSDQMDAANQRLDDAGPSGSAQMDGMADQRVETAIQAAREGKDVPTLDELADETFVDSQTEASAQAQAKTQAQAADEAETF